VLAGVNAQNVPQCEALECPSTGFESLLRDWKADRTQAVQGTEHTSELATSGQTDGLEHLHDQNVQIFGQDNV
jgi:hypothetical protein